MVFVLLTNKNTRLFLIYCLGLGSSLGLLKAHHRASSWNGKMWFELAFQCWKDQQMPADLNWITAKEDLTWINITLSQSCSEIINYGLLKLIPLSPNPYICCIKYPNSGHLWRLLFLPLCYSHRSDSPWSAYADFQWTLLRWWSSPAGQNPAPPRGRGLSERSPWSNEHRYSLLPATKSRGRLGRVVFCAAPSP